jgi:L-ascorbate metabolism protein UlaG (beta-lactamase superfamily)
VLHRHAWHWVSKKARRDLRFVKQMAADSFRSVLQAPHKPDPTSWETEGITLSWLGHATVLMTINGVKVLTDPVLGLRVGPAMGPFVFGPKRFVRAPLKLSQLPDIDLVLLTHAHMDHLDLYTLRRLKRVRRIVTARNTADLLTKAMALEIVEISTGEAVEFKTPSSIRVQSFPVRHPSARWRYDTDRTCNGYLLSSGGYQVVFIGDTAYADEFDGCLSSDVRPDLAIVPIGCYDPFIWNHCTPEQALRIAMMLRAQVVVPIHHSTFKLSRENLAAPMHRFIKAGQQFNLQKVPLRIGETYRYSKHTPEQERTW